MRRAALLALLVAVALPASAHASFPGKNGKIAFVSTRNSSANTEIFTMNPDGTGTSQLTHDAAHDSFPAWSPDGSKIAFVASHDNTPGSSRDLYLMNSDGGGRVRLTNDLTDDLMPTWSPDGRMLAFSRGNDIYRINSDGTGLTNLTNAAEVNFSPTWSPDGSRIAWDCARQGLTNAEDICAMNSDGSGLVDLTTDNPDPNGADIQPDWGPDASRLVFVRQTFGSAYTLFTMNPDGSDKQQITTGSNSNTPRWSPDGTKLVFECGTRDLCVMDSSGTGRTTITNSAIGNDGFRPSWQPIPINGYARPKGATPFITALAVAYKPCGSPNRQHGAPLDVLSCSPPQQASDFLTVGTLDANGQPAKSVGSVRYDVKPGTAANPADDADVNIRISIKDVRNKADLSDYPGELQVTSARRITDKLNTPAPDATTQAATTQDTPFLVTVPCAPTTSDTTIGSLCAISTTADAVVPGQVTENARSNWELGQVKVFDGGSDQDADTTADNTPFMDQGIFVP